MTTALLDHVPHTGAKDHVGHVDMGKDEIQRRLDIVDSALGALTPPVGTAREFCDEQREACKLGLGLLKLALQSVDSLGVMHRVRGVSESDTGADATLQEGRT